MTWFVGLRSISSITVPANDIKPVFHVVHRKVTSGSFHACHTLVLLGPKIQFLACCHVMMDMGSVISPADVEVVIDIDYGIDVL